MATSYKLAFNLNLSNIKSTHNRSKSVKIKSEKIWRRQVFDYNYYPNLIPQKGIKSYILIYKEILIKIYFKNKCKNF